MKKIFNAVCTIGKYTDKQGNEKNRYINVGVVLEGERGLSLKLESLPIGFNGWINFYEIKENQPSTKQPDEQEAPPFDDDIGF